MFIYKSNNSFRNLQINNIEDVNEVDSSYAKSEVSVTSTVISKQSFEKKRKYAMSLATLAAKSEKRIFMVNEGALSILIDLANSHDAIVQVRCASAFASLSKEASIRPRMLEEGVLTAVLSMANNTTAWEVKAYSCIAICNLCCEDGYEAKMAKESVPFLVTHIVSSVPECLDVCLKILLNLSCTSDKFHRIEDITESLLFFTNFNLTLEQELIVVGALCNLSALRNNQLRLVEDGCLRIVEKHFKSPSKELRSRSCEVLKNLTVDYRTRLKLLEVNVMSLLLDMSNDPEEDIRTQCLKSLSFLSKDEQFRLKIAESKALDYIMNVCGDTSTSNTERGRVVAKTVQILCSDQAVVPILVRKGVTDSIRALLTLSDNQIDQYCIRALCALLQNEKVWGELISKEADKLIVSVGMSNKDKLIREWCAFSLFHLIRNQICVPEIVQTIVLPCVIDLCEDPSDQTKLFCSGAFACITLYKSADCSGAIPLLIKMLRLENGQNVKKYCAFALSNLADKNENCYIMLEYDALIPVVQLTQSDNIETKVLCAGIISRLSLHKDFYHRFAVGSVLKVLLELSCVDHRITQRRVVIALSNLSQNEILRSMLIDLNPIPYIVSLAAERDEYLRRGCISIVCNMSYIPGSERAIVVAGITPTLLITSLITSDQIITKLICVKALVNLMADKSLYKHLTKDGIIWGLSKLAQLDNVELLGLCSKALCNLSAEFATEMLRSTVSTRCVLQIVKRPEVELKKAGAKTITNLLLKTTDADEDFRKHCVATMPSLAKSDDSELNEMCVFCLCLASQSESCRVTIVASGVLELIKGGTIFADSNISYAYITLFSNIANDPSMRPKVLDDLAIQRFANICMAKDHHIDLAVAKALYCVSCSKENVPKLVDQKIIPFLVSLLEAEYDGVDRTTDFAYNLIACLYNLTTCPEVQATLVSQGFVEVLMTLWPDAEKNFKICNIAYLSICNLACGRTNSARLVADGCTSILCFITEHKNEPEFSHYNFGWDAKFHGAAALRNLLFVISNQKVMVQEGCLETIIKLANESIEMTNLIKLNANNNISTTNFSNTNLTLSALNNLVTLTQQNCSVCLQSMTFNKEIREKLLSSEAISIILDDIKSQGTTITPQLLRELEEESWDNGSRSRKKADGRVKDVPIGPLFTNLLGGTSNVQLNVALKCEELSKFYVQVQLDKPASIVTDTGNESVENVENGDVTLDFEDIGITDFVTHEENEDFMNPIVQAYSKQGYDLDSEGMQLQLFSKSLKRLGDTDYPVANTEEVVTNNSSTSKAAPHQSFAPAENGVDSFDSIADFMSPSSSETGRKTVGQSQSQTDRQSTSQLKLGSITSFAGLLTSAVERELTTPKNTKKLEPLIVTVPKKTKPKKIKSTPDLVTTGPPVKATDDDFQDLIQFIRKTKQGQGGTVEEIMNKWNAMSRF